MLKGTLDLAVLAVLRERDGYGYDILRRLRSAGVGSVADASVYGSLRRLQAAGSLRTYETASAEGPPRRYYALTDRGRAELASGGRQWHDLARAMDGLLSGDLVSGDLVSEDLAESRR
jgi:PadR family transcriptional regulator, regulatory protein PadR